MRVLAEELPPLLHRLPHASRLVAKRERQVQRARRGAQPNRPLPRHHHRRAAKPLPQLPAAASAAAAHATLTARRWQQARRDTVPCERHKGGRRQLQRSFRLEHGEDVLLRHALGADLAHAQRLGWGGEWVVGGWVSVGGGGAEVVWVGGCACACGGGDILGSGISREELGSCLHKFLWSS